MTIEDKYVCRSCIEDSGLQKVVEKNQEAETCSYCGAKESALLETVFEHMMSAIATEYGDIEDNLDVNGQVPDHCDIEGVFFDIGFGLQNEDLWDDVVSHFGGRPFTLDKEKSFLDSVRHDAWYEFQEWVKHERRYTFGMALEASDPELDTLLWTPRNLLENAVRTINEFSLVVPIDKSVQLWRGMVHDSGDKLDVPSRFTSPPRKFARYPNRMSPAGVPMFYGASDFETAVAEIVDPEKIEDGQVVSAIAFRPTTDFLILDLTDVPHRTGFFDEFDEWQRRGLGFLSSFVHDLAKPIKKDGREHIEYVPPQVFTEYVRHVVKPSGGGRIMGIKYKSSKNGHDCYVIFVEQEGCLPAGGLSMGVQFLEAVPDSLRSQPLTK